MKVKIKVKKPVTTTANNETKIKTEPVIASNEAKIKQKNTLLKIKDFLEKYIDKDLGDNSTLYLSHDDVLKFKYTFETLQSLNKMVRGDEAKKIKQTAKEIFNY
jgi:hypothetical protein